MISLVICSRTKEISLDFSKNIENTVGCNYELVVIDNSSNQFSIFEAYNIGLKKSQNAVVCFLHDDILFKTNNWGKVLNEIFEENKNIGLIGVAGARVKTKMPSGWWNCPKEQKVIHIIQHFSGENRKEHWNFGFENKSLVEVAAIDGVFMALRKDSRFQFSPKMKGFHNYDLNVSFEYHKLGYKLVVTNEILIEHFSNGRMNKEWVDSTFKIHKIYKNILPIKIGNFSSKNLKILEFENGVKYVNHALNHNLKKNSIVVWLNLLVIKPYSDAYIKFSKKMARLIFK